MKNRIDHMMNGIKFGAFFYRRLKIPVCTVLFIGVFIGLFIGLFSFSFLNAAEHQLKFETIGPNNGFHQSVIMCIHQDTQGFMWFGTRRGLSKYDGYTFTQYDATPTGTHGTGHQSIHCIYEDREKTLWFGSQNYLDRYDRGTQTFQHFQMKKKSSSPHTRNIIFSIHDSPRTPGILWLGTLKGLYCFDKTTGTFYPPPGLSSGKNDNFPRFSYYIVPDFKKPGILWLFYNRQYSRYDIINKEMAPISSLFELENLSSLDVDDMISHVWQYDTEPEIIWISTGKGLFQLDTVTKKILKCNSTPQIPAFLTTNTINCVAKSPLAKDTYWFTTGHSGLYKWNRETGKYFNYRHSRNDYETVSSDNIGPIYQTASGILWVGTMFGGLNKADDRQKRFKHYYHSSGKEGSLGSDTVWSIQELPSYPGKLWIGTAKGLECLDRDSEKFTFNEIAVPDSSSRKDMTYLITSIYEAPSHPGIIWMGTRTKGMGKFNPANGSITHYRPSPGKNHPLPFSYVSTFHQPSSLPGILFLGTYGGGLQQLDIKSESFSLITGSPQRIFQILEPAPGSGILWLGTHGKSIGVMDLKTNTFSFPLADATLFSTVYTMRPSQSTPGKIWLATAYGLSWIMHQDGRMKDWTSQVFLSRNSVFGVLEDKTGNVWCSTDVGLFKVSPDTGEVKSFDIRDGLQGNLFTAAQCKTRDGEMFFGGYGGFNGFFPHQIKDNPIVPPVVITDFHIFNKPVNVGARRKDGSIILNRSISVAKEINLSYKENIISFQYTALSYRDSERNQYAYMMEGFDKDWNWVGNRRLATYTALPPGHYTFKVKGSNNDGVWNDTEASVRVIIHPPWWRTRWAYFLYIALIISIVSLLNRWQQKRLIRKERQKSAIHEAQLRAVAAEAQARAIDAENRRKTQELEEARKLQLSMLPRKLPQVPGVDIAAYIDTAAEVGGDYYDFSVLPEGSLIAAVGDATGHGLKAGTMVAVMKTIFINKSMDCNLENFFKESNTIIKRMNLGNLFMAMTLVCLKGNQLQIASGGMPPSYIFRKETGSVERVLLKAPPMGAFDSFYCKRTELLFNEGDMLFLFTDGLPELFNPSGEMFGYQRVEKLFRDIGHGSSQDVVEHFVKKCKHWLAGHPLSDDMTLLVLKRENK